MRQTKAAADERTGVVTFRGEPVTLLGPELKVGDKAPDFQCVTCDLEPATLGSTAGRVRLFSVVTSLDTSVCDQQARRFDREAVELPPTVAVIAVSTDPPFTQARWCALAEARRLVTYSDHRETSFGLAYGVLIKELRFLARSIFVVDRADVVRYVEIVPEVSSLPDFTAALEAVRELS